MLCNAWVVPFNIVGGIISHRYQTFFCDIRRRPKSSTALSQSTIYHTLNSSSFLQMMLCVLLRGVGLRPPILVSVVTPSTPVRTDVFYLLKYYSYEFI